MEYLINQHKHYNVQSQIISINNKGKKILQDNKRILAIYTVNKLIRIKILHSTCTLLQLNIYLKVLWDFSRPNVYLAERNFTGEMYATVKATYDSINQQLSTNNKKNNQSFQF